MNRQIIQILIPILVLIFVIIGTIGVGNLFFIIVAIGIIIMAYNLLSELNNR